jgi:predicted lipid-binding transport protein (Tim44 family)
MNLQMVTALSGAVVAVTGSLMLVVAAFRTSTGWGLATLLLPGAFLLFVFAHWKEARSGFFALLLALGLIAASGAVAGRGSAPDAARRPAGASGIAAPAAPLEAAPAAPPAFPPPSPQPSPAVRWVGQARDAAAAAQQQGTAGAP